MFGIILLFTFFFYPLCAAEFELPEQFEVNERWLSWARAFDIETSDSRIGSVYRRLLTIPAVYEFYDVEEELQAVAEAHFWTLGAIFDVTDSEGKQIGSVLQRLFELFPTFEIVSPSGEIQAVAHMNVWGTAYSIQDPETGQEIVTLSRSFFRIKDNWRVTLMDVPLFRKKQIDPRLFITLMAFQTDCDAWKRRK